MSGREHRYTSAVIWTGNTGAGTATYAGYSRDHVIGAPGKPEIAGSSDPAFRGDGARYNPEDLLVASIASCHMLWYLHLAAEHGIVVTSYEDHAEGVMLEETDGAGAFERVTLKPRLHLAPGSDAALALSLHAKAHEKCFISRSVNFPVYCDAAIAGTDESF